MQLFLKKTGLSKISIALALLLPIIMVLIVLRQTYNASVQWVVLALLLALLMVLIVLRQTHNVGLLYSSYRKGPGLGLDPPMWAQHRMTMPLMATMLTLMATTAMLTLMAATTMIPTTSTATDATNCLHEL